MEITARTLQGRFLLPPTAHFARIFVGVLAKAQAREPVRLHAAVCMSSHLHLLASVKDARQMAEFMQYFLGNLAREAGRLVDWQGTMFPRRYSAIRVSDEEAAQIERLRYLLSHGVKENLVARPGDWPGLHCARALMAGETLQGIWYNRSLIYEAGRRGQEIKSEDYITEHEIELQPLPCWQHLPKEAVRSKICELVQEIESKAATQIKRTGKRPLGVTAIQRQHPHRRPMKLKTSPAPPVHAVSKAVRRQMLTAQRTFVAAYRIAAELLRAGNRNARFPEGSFPPALPFISWHPAAAGSIVPRARDPG